MRGLEPSPREKLSEVQQQRKLWITGRVTEVREEWMEEAWAHCERRYDDEEVQEVRPQDQRGRGESREAWTGERMAATLDCLRRARSRCMDPGGWLVSEMMRELPM